VDLRRWTGVRFVCRAPTKGGGEVELRVAHLTLEHALFWQARVQPVIDSDPERVDQGWNWLLYLPFSKLTGKVLQQSPVGYCVGIVATDRDYFIPCALLQLLGRYPALNDHDEKCAFTWFLTTAPRAALTGLDEYHLSEDRVPKKLGTIALDVAVTHSLNHGGRGRTGLHADPKGGDRLLDWYQRRGMKVLPTDRQIPFGPRRFLRPSDGRYCYYTVRAALEASRSLDPLR